RPSLLPSSTASRTTLPGSSCGSCGRKPILSPGIGTASPSISLSIPAMMRSRLDLPEPFKPSTPIFAPGKKESEMSFRICRLGGTILPTRFIVYTYCAMAIPKLSECKRGAIIAGSDASGEPGPQPKATGSEQSRVGACGRQLGVTITRSGAEAAHASGEPGPQPKARGSEQSRVGACGRQLGISIQLGGAEAAHASGEPVPQPKAGGGGQSRVGAGGRHLAISIQLGGTEAAHASGEPGERANGERGPKPRAQGDANK